MTTITLDSPESQYLAERDWRLRHLMQRIGTFEYAPQESAFHNLVHSIIEQMISMKAGRVIEARLVERCGGILNPEQMKTLTIEEIKSCGMSLRKAQNIHALAEYAMENDLESLCKAPDCEVTNALMRLPGIGKWTCDMFLLFYLGRPDVLPVEDGALRQAFLWLYGVSLASSDAQELICSLWHPYSSTAALYLYRALNIDLVKDLLPANRLWLE